MLVTEIVESICHNEDKYNLQDYHDPELSELE